VDLISAYARLTALYKGRQSSAQSGILEVTDRVVCCCNMMAFTPLVLIFICAVGLQGKKTIYTWILYSSQLHDVRYTMIGIKYSTYTSGRRKYGTNGAGVRCCAGGSSQWGLGIEPRLGFDGVQQQLKYIICDWLIDCFMYSFIHSFTYPLVLWYGNNVNANVNSRLVKTQSLCAAYANKTRAETFSGRDENCQKNTKNKL